MSSIGPTLETPRLTLRPMNGDDFKPLCEMMADPRVMKFLGGVQSPNTVWRTLATMAGAWHIRGFSMFSVIEKETGKWIGRIGPWYPEGWPDHEIGWSLIHEAQGKGYALEGAAASLDYAFSTLGWKTAIHCIERANKPSLKLAERLGSRFMYKAEAPVPIKKVTWHCYGQSACEWAVWRRNLSLL